MPKQPGYESSGNGGHKFSRLDGSEDGLPALVGAFVAMLGKNVPLSVPIRFEAPECLTWDERERER